MKHTQGKWEFNPKTKHFTSENGNVVPMPSMFSSSRPEIEVFKGEPNWHEAQANAKLIAAAPELLDALQHIVERIGVVRKDDAFCQALKDNAINAINKATL